MRIRVLKEETKALATGNVACRPALGPIMAKLLHALAVAFAHHFSIVAADHLLLVAKKKRVDANERSSAFVGFCGATTVSVVRGGKGKDNARAGIPPRRTSFQFRNSFKFHLPADFLLRLRRTRDLCVFLGLPSRCVAAVSRPSFTSRETTHPP